MSRIVFLVLKHASVSIVMPIGFIAASLYAWFAVTKPGAEFYPLGLSVFGVTVALAAVCLAVPGDLGTGARTGLVRHAGEKLLHTSILLIQVLFAVFMRDSLQASSIAQRDWVKSTIGVLMGILLALILAGAYSSMWSGLEALNEELWLAWQRRLGAGRVDTNNSAPPGNERHDT